MANVTTSTVILQPLSTLSGDYPSATNGSNGFTTVTVNYGDNVIIPISSGSTGSSAGTANYGYSPNGTVGITQGTLSFPGTTYSSSNTTINATVSSVKTDGLISFWCPPSDGGSSVGWRARVQVNVNLDTTISLNSTSISIGTSDTYYQNGLTGGGAGTIYYVFNVSNISNGTNLDALRTGGDSRYIARTFTTATSKPFSTDGTLARITNDLPTSGSKTFYIYAANLSGQNSQYLGYSYTVSVVAQAPSVSATKEIILNGFGLYSNPTGTTSGTVTYQWSTNGGGPNSKSSYSTGYTSNQSLGVGTEWIGTTWTCQARATVDGGSTYVYSGTSSTTLPTYSVTAPTSIEEGQSGTFTVTSTNGLGPIYWEATTTSGGDFSTSTGQVGSGSASSGTFTVTPTSDGTTEGSETATVKLYINNTYNSLNYIYATDTFTITDPPATPTAPVVSNTQTFATTASPTTTCTIALTSSGTNGTLEYNVTTSTTVPTSGWQTSATVSVSRGTSYYFWARRSSTAYDRSDSAITVPYLPISDSSITIGIPTDKDGNALSTNVSGDYVIPNTYGTSAGDNILIPYSDGGSVDQYRIVSDDATNKWLDTRSGVSNTFVLEMNSSGGSYSELPAAGQTWEYTFEGRRRTDTGGHPSTDDAYWTSVDGTQVRRLYREPASTYTIGGPNSINEGQTLTFAITTSNVLDNTTVAWTLGGTLQSGDYTTNDTSPATITNNSASVAFSIVNDNVADGNKTATLTLAATDSTGASTGTPSKSVTVVDTSNPGGGGGSGATVPSSGAGTYGLLIRNSNDTQTIIDGSSRITNFLASDSIDTNSQASKVMFTNFDCSEKTVTGFLVTWDGALFSNPIITRRSSSLGGITVTKNANDTGSSTAGVATIELVRY